MYTLISVSVTIFGPESYRAYSLLIDLFRRAERAGVAQMEKVLKLMRDES